LVCGEREEEVMATQAQIEANSRNGKKGGVKTEEGKMISRHNARKHGVFASALTERDKEEVRPIHEELAAELKPGTVLERMLVDKIAVTCLRLERCGLLEAAWLEAAPMPFDAWNPESVSRNAEDEPEIDEQALADFATAFPDDYDRHYGRSRPRGGNQIETAGKWLDRMNLISRYDTTLTNQFLRLIRELERLQGARCSESQPVAVLTPAAAAAAGVEEEHAPEPAPESTPAEEQQPEHSGLRNEPNPDKAAGRAPHQAPENRASQGSGLRNEPNPDEANDPMAHQGPEPGRSPMRDFRTNPIAGK